jgi:hypothetical protein
LWTCAGITWSSGPRRCRYGAADVRQPLIRYRVMRFATFGGYCVSRLNPNSSSSVSLEPPHCTAGSGKLIERGGDRSRFRVQGAYAHAAPRWLCTRQQGSQHTPPAILLSGTRFGAKRASDLPRAWRRQLLTRGVARTGSMSAIGCGIEAPATTVVVSTAISVGSIRGVAIPVAPIRAWHAGRQPRPDASRDAGPRHPPCHPPSHRAAAGVTAEVRTKAPTVTTIVRILLLFIEFEVPTQLSQERAQWR